MSPSFSLRTTEWVSTQACMKITLHEEMHVRMLTHLTNPEKKWQTMHRLSNDVLNCCFKLRSKGRKWIFVLLTPEYWLLAQSHNAICFGGLFALKQCIFCSLKHDTVPRVNNLYCFYVKNPPKQITLWVCASSQLENMWFLFVFMR